MGQTQRGSNIFPELQNEEAGWYVSMSADGNTVAVGGQAKDENNKNFARARVYNYDGQDWVQKGQSLKLLNYSGDYSSKCRVSLSADGNILAFSSPNQGILYSGIVMIYQYKSPNWELLGNYFVGGPNTLLGNDVSLSADGNILATVSSGYYGANNEYGATTIHQLNGNWWDRLGQIIEGYSNSNGKYSFEKAVVSLSDDGTVVAVGTPLSGINGNYKGEVRIYKYTGGLWVQMGESIFSDEGANFGTSIALSGDGNTFAVGKVSDTEMGYVRVFEHSNGHWIPKGMKLYGNEVNDAFGASVTLSSNGTILTVGSPRSNISSSEIGLAKIFKFDGNDWNQIGNDIIGSATNDLFGQDVSISSTGNFLAISSPYFDNPPYTDSGNVKVYDLSDILAINTIETKSFSLYPNPAQEFLKVGLEDDFELIEVTIYNSMGQLIKREKTDVIDLSGLATGVYYIKIISPQLEDTKMFIKN